LRNPAAVSYAGGLKSSILSILEGPTELLHPIVKTFIYLVDTPDYRCYIRPQIDLDMVISQFTDAFTSKQHYPMERLQLCGAVIQEVLSYWTGLFYFTLGDKQAIRAIIEALSLPNEEIRVWL
jgi:rapamycin-insensitive companion of mTOR